MRQAVTGSGGELLVRKPTDGSGMFSIQDRLIIIILITLSGSGAHRVQTILLEMICLISLLLIFMMKIQTTQATTNSISGSIHLLAAKSL